MHLTDQIVAIDEDWHGMHFRRDAGGGRFVRFGQVGKV
jgi:hypothetical protein